MRPGLRAYDGRVTDDDATSDAWPDVAADPSIVGSVTDAGLGVVSRLFLPLAGAYETQSPWAPLFRWSGETFDAGARWEALATPGNRFAAGYEPRWGTVDAATIDALVDALRAEHGTEEVDVVLWDVYADDAVVGAVPVPAVAGGNRWQDGSHRRARLPLDGIADFADETGARFPVAIFPPGAPAGDGGFLIAAPGYSDSLFVSGGAGLMTRLADAGFELFRPGARILCRPVIRWADPRGGGRRVGGSEGGSGGTQTDDGAVVLGRGGDRRVRRGRAQRVVEPELPERRRRRSGPVRVGVGRRRAVDHHDRHHRRRRVLPVPGVAHEPSSSVGGIVARIEPWGYASRPSTMGGMTDDTAGSDAMANDVAGHDADGHDDFADARAEGQRIERDRVVAYLAKHEATAKAAAETVTTEESRVYQTTIAKAMTAMREAIAGEFHWRGEV